MNPLGCDEAMDMLPALASGALPADRAAEIDDHLAGCDDCRETLALIRALRAREPTVPGGLEARVRAALPEQPRRMPGRYGRRIALAASVAGALLVGRELVNVALETNRTARDESPPTADSGIAMAAAADAFDPNLTESHSSWPGADGSVAGAAMLEDLSVEELEALLQELES